MIVDSNHLRAIHSFKISLNQYLENTLHGKIKPFITRCTLASILQTIDLHTSRRPDFLPPPADLPLRHCSHAEIDDDDVLSEEDCLLDLLSGGVTGNQLAKNKQHFILATADAPVIKEEKKRSYPEKFNQGPTLDATQAEDIRVMAREIPGVPIIYVKRSVMTLEELSGASLNVRRRAEKDKFREGLLGSGSRKRKRGTDDQENGEGHSRDSDASETPKIKKKRNSGPKAPNPLSVLKKKKKPLVRPPGGDPALAGSKQVERIKSAGDMAGPEETDQPPNARRKRKHRPKKKADVEAGAQVHNTPAIAVA